MEEKWTNLHTLEISGHKR